MERLPGLDMQPARHSPACWNIESPAKIQCSGNTFWSGEREREKEREKDDERDGMNNSESDSVSHSDRFTQTLLYRADVQNVGRKTKQ